MIIVKDDIKSQLKEDILEIISDSVNAALDRKNGYDSDMPYLEEARRRIDEVIDKYEETIMDREISVPCLKEMKSMPGEFSKIIDEDLFDLV